MRILILMILAVSLHASETLVKQTVSPGVFDKAVAAESLPGLSRQAALAQQLFQEHPADVIVRLAIYTSLTDATSAERPRGVTDISLTQWKTDRFLQKKGAAPALEILKVGGFAAIRRFEGGGVTNFMIPPYQSLAANLSKANAVYFVAVTANEHRTSMAGQPAGVLVNVYLKYDGTIDVTGLQEVVSTLALKKIPELVVSASSDARYILADDVPAFNRFINPDWYKAPHTGETFNCSKYAANKPFICDP